MGTMIFFAILAKTQYISGGKLKPIIKTKDQRWKLANWIVEKFPNEYREMTYLEPFLGCGSVFILKDASKEEVLNDSSQEIMNIWWALRDEHEEFISKLKRTKYSESTFKKMTNSKENDYLLLAIKEFVLRHMSKNGMKKSFLSRVSAKGVWSDLIELIEVANKKIESSFLFCKDPIEILKVFDLQDTFVYINTPEIDEENFGQDKHMEMGEILRNFRGKVLLLGPNSALYKRMCVGWTRKSVPNSPKESIWVNF